MEQETKVHNVSRAFSVLVLCMAQQCITYKKKKYVSIINYRLVCGACRCIIIMYIYLYIIIFKD